MLKGKCFVALAAIAAVLTLFPAAARSDVLYQQIEQMLGRKPASQAGSPATTVLSFPPDYCQLVKLFQLDQAQQKRLYQLVRQRDLAVARSSDATSQQAAFMSFFQQAFLTFALEQKALSLEPSMIDEMRNNLAVFSQRSSLSMPTIKDSDMGRYLMAVSQAAARGAKGFVAGSNNKKSDDQDDQPATQPSSQPSSQPAEAAADLNNSLTGDYAEMAKQFELSDADQERLASIQQEEAAALEKFDASSTKRKAALDEKLSKAATDSARKSAQRSIDAIQAQRDKLEESYYVKALNVLSPKQRGEWMGSKLQQAMKQVFSQFNLDEKQQSRMDEICIQIAKSAQPSKVETNKPLLARAQNIIARSVLDSDQKKQYAQMQQSQKQSQSGKNPPSSAAPAKPAKSAGSLNKPPLP